MTDPTEEVKARLDAAIKEAVDPHRAEYMAWLAQHGVPEPTTLKEFVGLWSVFTVQRLSEGLALAIQGIDP